MEYTASGKRFTLYTGFQSNDALRASFNSLAAQTFDGLSFEGWYQAGHWGSGCRPYALADGEQIVAGLTANRINFTWNGTAKAYLQLGTVMTAPACRGMGLARRLVQQVLEDWRVKCGCIYLFANDAVVDFYPKHGFTKADEYNAVLQVKPRPARVQKLDIQNEEDAALLRRCYAKGNPFSAFATKDAWDLLCFHCAGPVAGCLYYVPDCDAVVIAGREEHALTVYDIYGGEHAPLAHSIGAVACDDDTEVILGFAPKDVPENGLCLKQEHATTLFILGGTENLFREHKTMFPLLSHT